MRCLRSARRSSQTCPRRRAAAGRWPSWAAGPGELSAPRIARMISSPRAVGGRPGPGRRAEHYQLAAFSWLPRSTRQDDVATSVSTDADTGRSRWAPVPRRWSRPSGQERRSRPPRRRRPDPRCRDQAGGLFSRRLPSPARRQLRSAHRRRPEGDVATCLSLLAASARAILEPGRAATSTSSPAGHRCRALSRPGVGFSSRASAPSSSAAARAALQSRLWRSQSEDPLTLARERRSRTP
jgi:hypothetical protein